MRYFYAFLLPVYLYFLLSNAIMDVSVSKEFLKFMLKMYITAVILVIIALLLFL